MNTALQWLLVFGAVTLLDFVWAGYTRAMAADNKLWASGYATAIIVLGGTAIHGYANNLELLVPAAAGAFLGTWLAMSWKRHS